MSHGTVSFRAIEGVNVVAVISKESFFVTWQLHSESSEATKKTVLTGRTKGDQSGVETDSYIKPIKKLRYEIWKVD